MIDSYDVLWSSYDRHKLIYKVQRRRAIEALASRRFGDFG